MDSHLNSLPRAPHTACQFASADTDTNFGRPQQMARMLAVIAVIIAASGYAMIKLPDLAWLFWSAQLFLLLIAAGQVMRGCHTVQQYLRAPLDMVARWAAQIHKGNLAARVPEPQYREFLPLARDINSLSERLQLISDDVEAQVGQQTERLARKTRSLQLMYDVAASINMSRDLDALLKRFLDVLSELLDAKAASVRLRTADDQLRLVASMGLDATTPAGQTLLPLGSCLGGEVIIPVPTENTGELGACAASTEHPFYADERSKLVAVPLVFQDRLLGLYSLFVEAEELVEREDIREVLAAIGRHLGMAIERAGLDHEAERLSRMEERTRLAHELHDSLAQTLASIRLQIRVLDQTLHESNESEIWREMELLENSIDEAYSELRELIAHFRAPVCEGGLIAGIEEAVERLRRDTGMRVFFQNEWHDPGLPPEAEIQALRIVQESLANIRKHSEAKVVRVILRSDVNRGQWTLIEDDGVGFVEEEGSARPGEHIGLAIMSERAERIGAELQIESEPGEGTRVVLRFGASTPLAEAV